MRITRRQKLIAIAIASLAPLFLLLRPFWHLFSVLRNEETTTPYESPDALIASDASRLTKIPIRALWSVDSDHQQRIESARALLKQAKADRIPISLAGSMHSMGGHTAAPGCIRIDNSSFNWLDFDSGTELVTVGSGITWRELIAFLDPRGYSPKIMQSNHDFSIGGSLSANAHGWQTGQPPLGSTIESFRILLASGDLLECSRDFNRGLFRLAIGGYGLFGIIIDLKLRVTPNKVYRFLPSRQLSRTYAQVFEDRVRNNSNCEMAYGRLCIDSRSYLSDSVLTTLEETDGHLKLIDEVDPSTMANLSRLIFRGSAASEYGKRLRWDLETGKYLDLIRGLSLTRNQILNEPVSLFQEKSAKKTDILQEYFIKPDKLEAFLAATRLIIPKYKSDLLNITIRDVSRDQDSILRYAEDDVFALVMLFSMERSLSADRHYEGMTRELIDAVASLGGSYYLPYRLHASRRQFYGIFPQAERFFEQKNHYDPSNLFQNQFYLLYRS